MAQDDDDGAAKKIKAYGVFVRLVLPPYTIHFKSPTYMKDATLELLDKKVCKETLKSTVQQAAVREVIGTDALFWPELCGLLKAAIPSLERRSFTIWDPSSVDYESTSGALIASHHPGLWKDLERLNDLVSIGRNVLTVGASVQDLAAAHTLDAEIFRLINCCVRVTARGYDGDAGTGDEEKWQWIVNAYKKLLITSLQFLNNLAAQNEKRKLALWVSLFDNNTETVLAPEDVPETSRASLTDIPSNPISRPISPLNSVDLLVAFGTNGTEVLNLTGAQPLWEDMPFSDWPLPKEALEGKTALRGNGYAFYVKRATEFAVRDWNIERRRDPTAAEIHLDMPRRWAELLKEDHDYWQTMYEDAVAKYLQDLAVYEAKMLALTEQQPILRSDVPVAQQTKQVERKIAMLEEHIAEKYQSESTNIASTNPPTHRQSGLSSLPSQTLQSRPVVAEDMRMLFTASAGTKILESGKAELMKRLEGYDPPDPGLSPSRHAEDAIAEHVQDDIARDPAEQTSSTSQSPPLANQGESQPPEVGAAASRQVEGSIEDSVEEDDDEDVSEEEDEEDEEDYPGSTEDGRGLLTDVPLILGPSEIEVLPMLIMSGIVSRPTRAADQTAEEKSQEIEYHAARTHILLAQSNGRNLLRELLIFVAAWDLREEELYFKFMVKIIEAILNNGLMPYAYHAFRDRSRSKDIISPAQAVIMKLLTCIFRARGEAAKQAVAASSQQKAIATTADAPTPATPRVCPHPHMPTRVDLHILNFIFTEFRQHIIPQTCALIFLQGQIHAGRASPEDFPLNLWDMERMYEGVYQYLEFFAVLTEEGVWKGILGEWEMASELVTLLRELEGGIPKMGAVAPQNPRRVHGQRAQSATSSDQVPGVAMPAHNAIERPFDVDAANAEIKLAPLAGSAPNGSDQTIFEAETPLAYPEDPVMPIGHDLQHDQDEPSDFEWRNLKKLTVLVLSSLIWKNRKVQDQVRRYGGLEALVGCCRHDEHNPYIREHAIMCLRFAVENCEENNRLIRQMAHPQQHKALDGGNVTLGTTDDVPREVLDTQGYETFMDTKGQVGLRPKEVGSILPSSAATSSISGPPLAGVSKTRYTGPKVSPEKAAELMQTALRELPTTTKFATNNIQQRDEALAKLDMAFESTEKMLSRARKS